MPLGAKQSTRPGRAAKGACQSHSRCGQYQQVVHEGLVPLFSLTHAMARANPDFVRTPDQRTDNVSAHCPCTRLHAFERLRQYPAQDSRG